MGLHSKTRYHVRANALCREEAEVFPVDYNKVAVAIKVYRYSIEEISHNRKGTVRDGTDQELPF